VINAVNAGKDRPAALPSEHNGLLIVVQTLPRHPAIVLEGVLMPADEAVEVMASREVDVVASLRAQDVGENTAPYTSGAG